MKIFNTLFLLIAMLFSSSSLYAEDFNVDGIYYNITNTSIAEVTYRGEEYSSYDNEYSGSVVIPETVIYEGEKYSVESIGEGAFYHGYGLTSVTIPNSVTSIGNQAFWGCAKLKEVYVFADNPVECGNNLKKVSVFTRNSVVCGNLTVFSSETYSNATLYVPEASISSYKSTIPWSSFSRIKANPKKLVGIYVKPILFANICNVA